MPTRKRSTPSVRLTSLAACAGCAAKLRPDVLAKVVAGLPTVRSRDALVGYETSDDAAVYRVSKDVAIVETVDFFPPVLDDPYAFGQVAAANAMSDVWAMGGTARFALNLVAFPKELPLSILRAILAGGADKAKEAGIPVLGGHTIQSAEPKYGMAVTGTVHPKRILTNAGGKAGDVLILTKPIGTGIATTAFKRDVAPKGLLQRVTAQMAALNKPAGEVFASRRFPVHALTDVTGFGLLGHLLEMARGAKLRAQLFLEGVPLLPHVAALSEAGVVPGGTRTNLEHVSRWVRFPKELPLPIRHVLADAQTNGGLLAAVPERAAGQALRALERKGVDAWVVGVFARGKPGIDVLL